MNAPARRYVPPPRMSHYVTLPQFDALVKRLTAEGIKNPSKTARKQLRLP